ncbi:D-2-hydroxyacid dehydrogenase [Campylobacter sp. MIT 99-7217]|uniref:D-2-hydroxyacid dehydrogenase n=1 Tax=Campylobacter sp. MIT 99-7217 TaxID=535091 RepID=UPI00115B5E9F|nr:D-2-hydroxyacid dehydrogenase [Campylobacter sp. MIT 99-7217]TQR34514.1 D-2-hydroxyacid dehydrogenase [Campylobacter sp. MIT 99-7217]
MDLKKQDLKIVCLDAATLGNVDLSIFESAGSFVSYDFSTKAEAIERLQGADVVIINKIVIDKELIDKTKLKLILITATGTNNIDLEYAAKNNIVVKNVAGYSTTSVAQHTFALLFAFLNQILYYDKFTKDGLWCKSPVFSDFSKTLYTLEGKKYGIIGLGAIGREVAKIASVFKAKIFYSSLSGVKRKEDYEELSLEELLKECDIISIHSPLNEKTRNLITKKELSLLKKGAILINVGRGGIINEEDLALMLDERDFRVGLDVLEFEPMKEGHPLLNIKKKHNLLITPHIAFAAKESLDRLIAMTFSNLKDFIDGRA